MEAENSREDSREIFSRDASLARVNSLREEDPSREIFSCVGNWCSLADLLPKFTALFRYVMCGSEGIKVR